jgi:hypothetical protein
MLRRRALALLATFALPACVTTSSLEATMPPPGPKRCSYLQDRIDWDDQIAALNRISELFRNDCHQETIEAGSKAREDFRHKEYSVVKESVELFVAEGTVTDYVLESYERGYLTFLISMSYLRQKRTDAVTVELNKLYNEEVALIYNHGQDPVNVLLQAVLWENFPREGFSSRPFWLWLSRSKAAAKELREFAAAKVRDVDAKVHHEPWQISALGTFPELDWSMKFADSKTGYFEIRPKRAFAKPCVDSTGILVPTTSWFHKIAIRHSHAYHPLVNAKSWIRLPIGIVYGVSTAVAGAGVMVGGCALDAALDSRSSGALCQISIEGGVAIMAESDDVVEAALRPDLRHWEKVPEAIYVSAGKPAKASRCATSAKALGGHRML